MSSFPRPMIPFQNSTTLPSLALLFFLLVFPSLLILTLDRNFSSGRLSESHANYQDVQDVVSMGGLLPPRHALDECHSRTRHHLYRKASSFKPSEYLLSKLRQYEKLHQQCAGEAESFKQALNSSRPTPALSCRFVVWVSYSGLGNKLVTLTATFLYALLTNRVLLIDRGKDMAELLCEPFPGASWLLPSDFPRDWLLPGPGEDHPNRFARMFDAERCIPDARHLNSTESVVYIHLNHKYNVEDRRFFCEGEQRFLSQVPWLFVKSNNYFVPAFYFMPTFRAEMEKMFPDSETIFHHLGRYLLHPSNAVWDRAARFYDSYLAEADQLVGLQLRTFNGSNKALELYSDEVLECLLSTGLIPNVTYNEQESGLRRREEQEPPRKSTSVLIASLHQVSYEKLRDLYVKFPTEDGSRVKVHLPSHEEFQKTDTSEHDKKALMEIFLLSLSDRLVTSPKSTFGYVAQGLAGVKPVLLRRLEDSPPEPACSRALSMEPCFHAPPLYDCDCQGGRDPAKVIGGAKHCQDVSWGIQLVN